MANNLQMYHRILTGLCQWHPGERITRIRNMALLLVGLTPFVSLGRPWIRLLSYALAVLMIVNALGHTLISIWLREPMPGAFSSPVLLVTAIALLVTTWRAQVARIEQNAH